MSIINGLQETGLVSIDTAVRRARLNGVRLSCPAWPKAGEGFADLLYRASSENGYETSAILLEMLGLNMVSPTHYGLAGKNIDPGRIADVLGLENQNQVAALLYEPTHISATHVMFFGREVRKKVFFESARRVSPLSLRRNCYQKAIWSVRGITFDPCNMEQLLTHCPVCEAPLSFFETHGVEICSVCKANRVHTDFRDFPQRKVEVDDEDILRFVVSLVDPERTTENIDKSMIHADLWKYGPGNLFMLIVSMARFRNYCVSSRGRTLDQFEKLRTPTCSEVTEAACAIINWPNGFLQYVEKLTPLYRRKFDEGTKSVQKRLPNPVRAFTTSLEPEMQQLLIATELKGRASGVLSSVGTLIANNAGEATPSRLASSGIWETKIGRSGLKRLYAAVDHCHREGEQLSESEAGHLLLLSSKAARWFSTSTGIAPPFITGLIHANLVQLLDDEVDKYLRWGMRPPPESLEARIAAISQLGEVPFGALPLAQAVAGLSTRRLNPWTAVLPAILQGRLSIWMQPNRAPALLDRIVVSDFSQLSDVISSSPESAELCGLPANVRTTMSILGLCKPSVSLMRSGKLLPKTPSVDAVWQFKASHISGPEIQRRLHMNGRPFSGLPEINREIDAAGIDRIGSAKRRKFITFRPRDAVEALYGSELVRRV